MRPLDHYAVLLDITPGQVVRYDSSHDTRAVVASALVTPRSPEPVSRLRLPVIVVI